MEIGGPHLHVQLMNPKFINKYLGNLDSIDGYLPNNSPEIKNILDPSRIIY